MGLLLGGSIMSVVELIDLFIYNIMAKTKKRMASSGLNRNANGEPVVGSPAVGASPETNGIKEGERTQFSNTYTGDMPVNMI